MVTIAEAISSNDQAWAAKREEPEPGATNP